MRLSKSRNVRTEYIIKVILFSNWQTIYFSYILETVGNIGPTDWSVVRGKALNMDHFYNNIRNIFFLQQIGTIFIVSVAYSSVDIVLEN